MDLRRLGKFAIAFDEAKNSFRAPRNGLRGGFRVGEGIIAFRLRGDEIRARPRQRSHRGK